MESTTGVVGKMMPCDSVCVYVHKICDELSVEKQVVL